MTEPDSDTRPATGRPTIRVSRGVGVGRTRLSAFDDALGDAGVADFNLVRLSSVIPPGAAVRIVAGPDQLTGAHGDLLFCVYAEAYASIPGEQAWAGLAWSSRAVDGAGLFVEHHAGTEELLEQDLTTTLTDLGTHRGGQFLESGRLVSQALCTGEPVCTVVIATYQRRGWTPAEIQRL